MQALYRRATQLGHVMHNPCRDVSLPTIRGRREHAADPDDAARMIRALPKKDQCVWAIAFYAGLRLGELRALRWEDIDETIGLIHVQRSWDAKEGEIETKSFAGRRDVPIIAALRPVPHRAASSLPVGASRSCSRLLGALPVLLQRALPPVSQGVGGRWLPTSDPTPGAALVRELPDRIRG